MFYAQGDIQVGSGSSSEQLSPILESDGSTTFLHFTHVIAELEFPNKMEVNVCPLFCMVGR